MQLFLNDLVAQLNQSPALFYFYIILISLTIGSFLNVVIYRLPIMMQTQWRQECRTLLEIDEPATTAARKTFNLMLPLSHCPKCEHKIAPWDNIPLLSYLLLRGKCRHCQTPISSRYFFVELLTCMLSLVVAFRFGVSLQCLYALGITWLLIAMSFIDIDEMFIPDEMVYLLLWGGLAASLQHAFISPSQAIIGALVGYLSLWTIATLFRMIMGKQGMGHGDFKLAAGLCAWLGWYSMPFIALASSVAGVVIAVCLMLFKGHQRAQPIPFGPFLAIAGWLALVYGREIADLLGLSMLWLG